VKRYEGARKGHDVGVMVDGQPLNPRFDLWNHSPTGFEWGYAGSGPAQLALAILADHCSNNEKALNLYQRFKWEVIAELPHREWILTSADINAALQSLREAEPVLEGVA